MQKKYLTQSSTFIYDSLKKVAVEGTYLNIIKATYEKPTGDILSGEKLKDLPLRSRIRQEYPLLLFNTVLGSPTCSS